MTDTASILDDGTLHPIPLAAGDGSPERLWLEAAGVESALGWTLKPEGLCRGDVCIPVRDREALVHDGALDLTTLAGLLGRPLALDVAEKAAALGTDAAARESTLAAGEAPDFALPDLSGQVHRLSDHRGKKVLLVAYASW